MSKHDTPLGREQRQRRRRQLQLKNFHIILRIIIMMAKKSFKC